MWSNPHSLLVGMHDATAASGGSLAVSYKAKHTSSLTVQSSDMLLGIYPNALKTCIHRQNLHMTIWSSCIHNWLTQGAAKMSISRWMDKQTIHLCDGILFGNKKKQAIKLLKHTKEPKDILFSERSLSEKATYYLVPSMWCSGKDKTRETIKRLPGVGMKGGRDE